MNFSATELIKNKKHGEAHTREEILWLIQKYATGEIPDYQMSAWAMAVCLKGMVPDEIAVLTAAMRDSGSRLNFSHLKRPRIDKHSTGGVGDKTSLIIGPILAAAGVAVPMIAGRGLGHTGGTIDKLESLPGFCIDLSVEEFSRFIAEKHFALIGQTLDICPADKKLYALRDVTATIDSLPLICASIMSKKLAEDLTGLVLDVKFGSGAFMKTVDEAVALASLLKSTGEKNNVSVTAVISNMNEPLGRFVGNSVEVHECAEIMAGRTFVENGVDYYENTRELSLQLSGHMLFLANVVNTAEKGYARAAEILQSGAALHEFKEFLKRQGPANLAELPKARFSYDILATRSGVLCAMNTEKIGLAAIEIGAGRKQSSDKLDHTAGLEVCCRLGQTVERGQLLFRVFANSNSNFQTASEIVQSALAIEPQNTTTTQLLPLVVKVLT